MGSIHQELYEAINARLYKDKAVDGSLFKFSLDDSSAYLRGGIDRDYDASRTKNYPYMGIATTVDSETFTPTASQPDVAAICTVKITITCNRDRGFAQADAVTARLLLVLNNTESDEGYADRVVFNEWTGVDTASTSTTAFAGILYRVSSARRMGGGVVAVDGKELKITETFQVVVSSKPPAAGVQQAFLLSDQSQTTHGIRGEYNLTNNSETVRYLATNSTSTVIPLGVPTPSSYGNFSIARAVTREKQLTKDCAIWTVQYSPVQVNVDRPVPRTEVDVRMEPLERVSWRYLTLDGKATIVPFYLTVPRASVTLTKLLVKSGGEAEVLLYQTHTANDVGKVWNNGGKFYIFTGARVTQDVSTGAILILANFWTNGPVERWEAPEYPGGGFSIASPALPPLHVFSVKQASPNPSNPTGPLIPPSVAAVPLGSTNGGEFPQLVLGDFDWVNNP